MNKFNASSQWAQEKEISALHDSIGEFNARDGMDLRDYINHEHHLVVANPTLARDEWEKIEPLLPELELFEDPESGQKLRVERWNWPEDGDVSGKTVAILNTAFSVSLGQGHGQYQTYLIAEELKKLDMPLVVFENPSYGESDELTTEQTKALEETGDFGPIARSMLGIAKSMGIEETALIGYSMGSALGAAIAAHASDKKFGIKIRQLLAMEDPRVIEQRTALALGLPVGLFLRFASEANNLEFTWQHPIDPVLREVTELKKALPKGLWTYGRSLGNGGLGDDLVKALRTQPDMDLTLLSANDSKVSPISANADLYKDLKAEFPDRFIRRAVIPGEGHAFVDSGNDMHTL